MDTRPESDSTLNKLSLDRKLIELMKATSCTAFNCAEVLVTLEMLKFRLKADLPEQALSLL